MTDSNNINREEVLRDHAQLIHRVVTHCAEPGTVPDLEQFLELAEINDWKKLVETIRSIMSGNRDRAITQGLDEEESIVIESILNGIDNPETLPPVAVDLNSDMAAPGIASLIQASIQGSEDSRNVIDNLTTQMSNAGGEYVIIAMSIRGMIEGERDINTLVANMPESGQKLITGILSELTMLETAK